MYSVRDYGPSCDFIIEEFNLTKDANVYQMVGTIVAEYKLLQDKLLLAEAKAKPLNKEKKRGRPRKSIS